MFEWSFLFCHIGLCLAGLQSFYRRGLYFAQETVWKMSFVFNILLLFLISQIPFQIFLFKWILLYIPLIVAFFLKNLMFSLWEQKFYRQLEVFVNSLIAQIKIGAGFRPAFKSSVKTLPHGFQTCFMEMLEMILFSKKPSGKFLFPPLQHTLEELKQADSSPRCLPILENLRHHLYIHSVFRRKVQSALLQVRIQSLVLCILYAGLLAFVLNKYGLKYIKVLLISLLLFTIGLLFLLTRGKKIKWTV